jgi:hypothetical protein
MESETVLTHLTSRELEVVDLRIGSLVDRRAREKQNCGERYDPTPLTDS